MTYIHIYIYVYIYIYAYDYIYILQSSHKLQSAGLPVSTCSTLWGSGPTSPSLEEAADKLRGPTIGFTGLKCRVLEFIRA